MKIFLEIDGMSKSAPNGTYDDAQRFLELIEATNPKSYDLQFEDTDRFLQVMLEAGLTMISVAKPVGNGQALCRYSKDTCNFSHASVVNIVNDFFDGETDFLYIDWNEALDDYVPINPSNETTTQKVENKTTTNGGCYVATAVYGSYDCPQVWTLRRFRDNTLAATWYGRAFIRTYYAISPTLVKWFGNANWFKKLWKGKLDRMVSNLNEKGVENTPYDDKIW